MVTKKIISGHIWTTLYIIKHFANVTFVSLKVAKCQCVDRSYPHVADDRRVRYDPKPVGAIIKKFLESCEGQIGLERGKGRNQSARVACDQYHGEQVGCEVQCAARAISRHHVRTCGYDVTAKHSRGWNLPVHNTILANLTLIVRHSPFAIFYEVQLHVQWVLCGVQTGAKERVDLIS